MGRIKYPIGIQSFSNIRKGGYVYVDKTAYLREMIEPGAKYVFLSRPRRFGKSLFLSMVDEFYSGRRELFEGLEISRYEFDWAAHPVFHFDLSGCQVDTDDSLEIFLNSFIERFESDYNIVADSLKPLGLRFKDLIIKAHDQSGKRVVILVDEYDKPLLESVDMPARQEIFLQQLRSFYSNLKSQDEYIEFAMLTGVTKFGHLSIFSDLNNLLDISMLPEFSGICGITYNELCKYLNSGVEQFAESTGATSDEVYKILKDNYDGYHFSPIRSEDVYNPFSVLNALFARYVSNYWFQTGTPTFLIKLIKKRGVLLRKFDKVEVDTNAVTSLSFDYHRSLYPLLYQSGYLTIKGFVPELNRLILGFPNREVEQGFFNQLMKIYVPDSGRDSEFSIISFYDDIMSGDAEQFMIRLQSLFADFNQDAFNRVEIEQHYQDIIFIIMKLMGFYTHVEYKTASGRIDLLVKTPHYIYIFEFKMNKSAREAIAQIDSKDYLLPFQADGRRQIKIGANFSDKIHTLSEWIIEEVE